MTKKDKILYSVVAVLVAILLLREGCNLEKSNELIKNISEYKTEAEHYKGLNGVEIAQNKALMLETQEQMKSLLSKNDTLAQIMEKYKDLKSVTIINNTTKIYNDSIAYDSIRIPCNFKPFPVTRDSVDYKFYGTIAPDYFKIDSLIIPDEQSVVFGLRKMGFLKRKEYTAEVVHSNKLVRTNNIGQYSVKEKRKIMVISVGGGYGTSLTDIKLQPYIGFNIGFPIISF